MDESRSVLSILLISSALALAFDAGFFLGVTASETSVRALSVDKALTLSYEGDSLEQTEMAAYEEGTGNIIPLPSNVRYDYSGSSGISVQQNVTQQNVCSSNTAYCYNEVDNDFNVNPP